MALNRCRKLTTTDNPDGTTGVAWWATQELLYNARVVTMTGWRAHNQRLVKSAPAQQTNSFSPSLTGKDENGCGCGGRVPT